MMNFMQVLSKDEIKEMNDDLVKWIRKELKGKYSTYIYNCLSDIRHLVEDMRRDKK